jgi:multiple sugar transport system substrate-binding protein
MSSSDRFAGNSAWLWLANLALLVATAAGCSAQEKTPAKGATEARRDIELKLVVVDDPPMAAAIERLRAEWKARTGATLAVEQLTNGELFASTSMAEGADAVIYPSGQLGLLAERGWIVPLPADYATNRELAWSDTFELLQVAETRWGQRPYAVPFGSAVLTCYYRSDLFDRFHKRPPGTWQEYHALAEFFSKRENMSGIEIPDTWSGTVEPLADGWAGQVLLARAAAYAKHRDHYSTLFKIDSMQPLIAGAPFVRALEELVAAARLSPDNRHELDPIGAREAFLAGRSALALAVPGHAADDSPTENATMPVLGFAELPGAQQVYDVASGTWENRKGEESTHVPLLCFAGRLGSITKETKQAAAALRLLAWLSGREWGAAVSSASGATTLYRRSQLPAPRPWLDPQTDRQAASQYAETVRDALSRQAYLFALRIPGEEQYLAALDAAVHAAVRGEKSPADALSAAATQWSKITAELGLDAQRSAYRSSVGLEP